MKKSMSIALTGAFIMAGLLAGCDSSENQEEKETKPKDTQVSEENTANPENKTDDKSTDDEKEQSSEIGSAFGDSTVYIDKKDSNKTISAGPIKLDIKGVRTYDVALDEEGKEYFSSLEGSEGTPDGENIYVVAVDMKVENTVDKDITFYPDQSILVTNTKEQVEASMESEDIGGDFLGKIEKEGTVVFFLKKSAKDVHTIELNINAPYESDTIEDVGEDLKIKVDLKEEKKSKEENTAGNENSDSSVMLSKEEYISYVNDNPDNEGSNYNKEIQNIIDENSDESASTKYQLLSEYAYKYKPSKKQLNTFTQYIINDYKNGTYLNRADEDKYMLTNIFKALLVERYYADNTGSNPYAEFAFDFMQNTRDVYRGNQAVGDEVTQANERQMDKSLEKM